MYPFQTKLICELVPENIKLAQKSDFGLGGNHSPFFFSKVGTSKETALADTVLGVCGCLSGVEVFGDLGRDGEDGS